jgi:hypothetical protein
MPLRTEALPDTDDQMGLVLTTGKETVRNVLLSRRAAPSPTGNATWSRW